MTSSASTDHTVRLSQAVASHGFRLGALLGQGTTGSVFEVRRASDNARFALKVIRRQTTMSAVAAEFRTFSRLRHPNIVRYRRLLDLGGTPGIVMEYISGTPLHEFFGFAPLSDGPLPPVIADPTQHAAWLRDAVAAIRFLHANGIAHGDIKPQNLLVTERGRTVLVDFDFFRIDGRSDVGLEHGWTPCYGVSDQVYTGASPETDWLALGRVWCHGLTGSPHTTPRPPDDVEVPPWFALAAQLSSQKPEQRSEAADALARLWEQPIHPITSRVQAMYGRDQQLAQIIGFANERERAGPLLVYGPAGVGKTLLLDHVRLTLIEDGAFVITAQCDRFIEVQYPLIESLVDGLADLIRREEIKLQGELPSHHAARLAAAFPVLQEFVDSDGARDTANDIEHAIIEALAWLLRYCGGSRLVLLIDDMQWLDEHSRWFSGCILKALGEDAPCIVAAARTPNAEAPRPWNPWRESDVQFLHLEPLAAPGIRHIAERELRSSDDPRLDAIVQTASGNPLFARVLARGARFRRDAPRDETSGIQEELFVHIQRLTPDARQLLTLVSVATRATSVALLRHALPTRPIEASISELVVAGLARVDDEASHEHVHVTHARVAETLLARLPEVVLRHTHRSLALSGEQTGLLPPVMLAEHFWGACMYERAGETLQHAAALALSCGRTSQAQAHYQKAHKAYIAGDIRPPTALLKAIADTYERLHELPLAIEAYKQLGASSDPVAAARGRRRSLELRALRGQVSRLDEKYAELCASMQIPWHRSRLQLMLATIWGRMKIRAPRPHRASSGRGGLDPWEGERIETLASIVVNFMRRDFLRTLEAHNRYLLAAEASGDPVHISVAYAVEGAIQTLGGSRASAKTWLEAARRLADQGEDPTGDLDVIVRYAEGIYLSSFASNRLAGEHLEKTLTLQSTRNTQNAQTRDQTRIVMLQTWLEQGRIQEVLDEGRRASDHAYRNEDLFTSLTLDLMVTVYALLARDDIEEAKARADQALEITQTRPALHSMLYIAHGVRLTVGIYEGDVLTALTSGPPIDRTLFADAWLLNDVDRVRYFSALGHACHMVSLSYGGLEQLTWSLRARLAWLRCMGKGMGRAQLIRYSLAASRAQFTGHSKRADAHRRSALKIAEGLDQDLYIALQRLCMGSEDAADKLRALGVVRPEAFARAMVCGRP